MKSFPNFRQLGAMDCGPVCLRIISNFYGKDFSIEFLREKSQITKLGVSLLGISEAAENIGFRTIGAKITLEQLRENRPLPCILHWNQNHFVVLYKLTKSKAYISDPAQGKVILSLKEFLKNWNQNKESGVALLLEPTQQFSEIKFSEEKVKPNEWGFLLFYLKKFRKHFVLLILGLLFSSAVLIVTPFLTQALVDKGIGLKNLHFVYLILVGQLLLFLGNSLVEILRNWLLLHMGVRINISLVSDFFLKLFKLPIHFFETHLMGDLLQRTNDHKRLENLLTIKSLNIIYAFINIVLFGSVLLFYNHTVFFLFFSGCLLGILWVLLFMRRRAAIDFRFFELYGQQQSKVIELLDGIEEIKISNSSKQKRWEWEEIQTKIYKVRIKSLSLDQIQHNGFEIIIRFTGILLTIITAKLVIENKITLGAMFAINMIVGQLTNPIYSIIDFIPAWQDAKLALLRINEVHNQKNEEIEDSSLNSNIPLASDISFKDVSFSYTGTKNNLILKNINLVIDYGKVTAIVGASGSGKTTLLKLLLKFYSPTEGKISLGETELINYSSSAWRNQCGVVMQGGKIFSDSIVNNIALGQEVDMEQIVMTSALANLDDFVNSNLPMGYFTKVGEDGLQLSEGQKQRLLLARAMYKNPDFLFLDEATSSLDAKNEREIMTSLNNFGQGKTVIIVAHRLSTVRNADKIIVLHGGEIVECGNHGELTALKGYYYSLIKEQLDLGN
jgi:ATP-binding cassette, subfamily B, bacterial